MWFAWNAPLSLFAYHSRDTPCFAVYSCRSASSPSHCLEDAFRSRWENLWRAIHNQTIPQKTCSFTTFIICARRDFVRFEPSKMAIWPSPSRYSTASCKHRSTHLARKSTYYQFKKDRFQTLEFSSLKNSGNGDAYSGKCFERTSAQEITFAL